MTWYSTICSFWINIWFTFSVWDYLVLTVFQLTLCRILSSIRDFFYNFFFDPIEEYVTVDFFITYCFLPFAAIPLLLLTAGRYTLPYSVRKRFCQRDTFDYYDRACPSTTVKSCSSGCSNRRGRRGNRNHIWWSRTRTRTKDNSDKYLRWNRKHKRWEYNDKYKKTKKTLTPPAEPTENWWSLFYSIFHYWWSLFYSIILSNIYFSFVSLLTDAYLFPLDFVRLLYSSCSTLYHFWCPRSNVYSCSFISSLLLYDAFTFDCDKFMPNGPVLPGFSSTTVDDFLSSFNVINHMTTWTTHESRALILRLLTHVCD